MQSTGTGHCNGIFNVNSYFHIATATQKPFESLNLSWNRNCKCAWVLLMPPHKPSVSYTWVQAFKHLSPVKGCQCLCSSFTENGRKQMKEFKKYTSGPRAGATGHVAALQSLPAQEGRVYLSFQCCCPLPASFLCIGFPLQQTSYRRSVLGI